MSDLLISNYRALIERRLRLRHLQQRKAELVATMPDEQVALGDLLAVAPLGRRWGIDRGLPVDRYYIERFLAQQRSDIRGRVLEVKDSGYTRMFGGDRVTSSDVLDIDGSNPAATLVADLQDPIGLPREAYDCLILTQTVHIIFDFEQALQNALSLLAPGGVLLCTLPTVSRINDENGPDGDAWRFTFSGARAAIETIVAAEHATLDAVGNVRACAAFLAGLAKEEIDASLLDETDPACPLLLTLRVVKPKTWKPLLRRKPRGHGAILAYHRISDDPGEDVFGLSVSRRTFDAHLKLLTRDCQPMSVEDLLRASAKGEVPDRAVALTFDDGSLSALTEAAPRLQAAGLAATFFVNGEGWNTPQEPWHELLARVFLSQIDLPARLACRVVDDELDLDTGTTEARQAAFWHLWRTARTLRFVARDELLHTIRRWLGRELAPRDSHRLLLAQEILALSRVQGMSIGAHTTHHLSLPSHNGVNQGWEILDNRLALERLLERPITSLAYPFGELSPETIAQAQQAGIRYAFTTKRGTVRPGVDLLAVPRIEAREESDLGRTLMLS